MSYYFTESVIEREANSRTPVLSSSTQFSTPKPSRGPKFAGVLSAKYTDDETGLVMYQLRAYSPELGRFISRDPIEEEGGENLYGTCDNDTQASVDVLGLALYAFDGTWNDGRVDKRRREDTNVWKLYSLYGGKLAVYVEGVGTAWWTTIPGGFAGAGGKNRVDRMYDALTRIYNKHDSTGESKVIDVIGFSRGAAEARDFVNKVAREGVPVGVAQEGSNLGVSRCYPKIRFLGLFDTVASFGLTAGINVGYALAVPPNVENVRHATALDEFRHGFPLHSVVDLKRPNDPRIVEEGFRGAHSDIGGGYSDGDLSNFALDWMYYQAKSIGVPMLDLPQTLQGGHSPVLHDSMGNWKYLIDRVKRGTRKLIGSTPRRTIYHVTNP